MSRTHSILRGAASCLLGAITAVLIVFWIRSYFIEDMWHRPDSGWEYIKISGGVISYRLEGYVDSAVPWQHAKWAYEGWRGHGWRELLGFGWHNQSEDHVFNASISFGLLTLSTLAWPIASLIGTRLKLRQASAGHCSRCGYDLRGTPERCPECGLSAIGPVQGPPAWSAPRFFRSRTIALLLTFLLMGGLSIDLLNACSNPIEKVGEPDKPLPEYHADRPFLFIHITPANSRRAVSGLILAIYPDGRIIRVTSESTIGESYIRGRLSTENLAQARRMLHDSGLLSTKPGGVVVVDGGAEHVGIRYEKHVTSWAHTPGYDYGPVGSRITQLKKNLLALPLEDPKPEPPQEWDRWPTEFYEGQNDR